MKTKIELIYDGKSFQPTPTAPVALPVGAKVVAEWDEEIDRGEQKSAWEILRRLAGTVEMPPDWSSNHDAYLYQKTPASDMDKDPE
ncbi:MAG: hypothetical protein OHK0029_12700 [Armatimonadaceae bacterium]